MITNVRHPLFQALAELSLLYPSMRFGQLCDMVASMACQEVPFDITDVEDSAVRQTAHDHMHHRASQLAIASLDELGGLPGAREELIQTLEDLWKQFPQLTWGQLMALAAHEAAVNIYDIEDDQMLEGVRKCLGKAVSV